MVKKMKKIFGKLLAILLCSFLFTVNVNAETEYKYDQNKVITSVEVLVKNIINMDEIQLQYYAENSMGWTQSASITMLNYYENETLGAFKNFGETEFRENGQLLEVDVLVRYEKANLKITTTLTNIDGELVPIKMDFKVLEAGNKILGEKMQTALFNSLIGLSSVFIVLILISFIIYLFKFIPKIQELFVKGDKNSPSAALDNVIAQIEEKEERIDDTELVAVITAAICAATGATSDSFVVRSIKKADRKKKRI